MNPNVVENIPFTKSELVRGSRLHLAKYSHVPEAKHRAGTPISELNLIYYMAKYLEDQCKKGQAA